MMLTYKELMKFYECIRYKIKYENMKYENETKKEPTYKEIESIVISKVENI
jgi:hypothetical protein